MPLFVYTFVVNLCKVFPKIYIVHGIKGYEEREKKILKDFSLLHLDNPLFFTESYNEEENEKNISSLFEKDIAKHLSKGALYCTLVHILIYKAILATQDEYAIIFENDVCFLTTHFKEQVNLILQEANTLQEPVIISIENSTLKFPSFFKTKHNQLLYQAKYGRCAGAYIINRAAVKNILQYLDKHKCNEVIDWWHNTLINKGIIKMYWAHPPLTEQGSFNGMLASSISNKKKSYLQVIKWRLEKLYKQYFLRLFKDYTI